MGCKKLTYQNFSFLEVIHPKKRVSAEKKRINYYPFGLKHKGYNSNVSAGVNSVAQKFKYNGVELEESLGLNLYEMDWRSYDPAIARWTSLDPVIHASLSPYNAFDNNPIFWNDPSGADTTTFTGKEAQDLFREIQEVYGDGSSNNSDDSNNNQEECCGGIKKFFNEVLSKTWGRNKSDFDFSSENYWLGDDGYTYYVKGDNEFYKIYFDRYEKIEELPPMMQNVVELPLGGAGTKGGAFAMNVIKGGKTSMVYLAKRGKNIIYVGITNNFQIRAAQHLAKKGIEITKIRGLKNLTREEARGVEQILIEFYGLGGKKFQTGKLLNRINSIAEKNPIYGESLRKGHEILKKIGFNY